MAVLSPEEVDRYHRDGWTVPSHRLPDGQLARLRSTLDDSTRELALAVVRIGSSRPRSTA